MTPLVSYFSNIVSKDIEGVDWLNSNEVALTLEHAKVDFVKNEFGWTNSDISIIFNDLRINQISNLPVFSELNGWLFKETKFDLVQAHVNSVSSKLFINDLFREFIPVNQFNAYLQIASKEEELSVKINHLVFNNDDLDLTTKGKFYIEDNEPYLDLSINIKKAMKFVAR